MRVAVFDAPGSVRIDDVAPVAPGPGELLIAVDFVGLCGSDLGTYRGSSSMVSYPVVPGHEISGRVVGRGEAVACTDVPDGSRVTVVPYFNCGDCPACRNGRSNACQFNQTLGVQRDGALATQIVVPREHVIHVPDLPAESVALIEPLSVGFHLSGRAAIRPDESVAVVGCGAVGLGAIAAAKLRGARVVAVDISEAKLELAQQFGADATVNSAEVNAVDALRELTGGDGPDVVLESAGGPRTFLIALEAVRFTGRMGVVSYSTADVSFNSKLIVAKELTIYGSRNALGEFSEVVELLKSGTIPVDALVTRTVDLEAVGEAMDQWKNDVGSVNKLLVRVS